MGASQERHVGTVKLGLEHGITAGYTLVIYVEGIGVVDLAGFYIKRAVGKVNLCYAAHVAILRLSVSACKSAAQSLLHVVTSVGLKRNACIGLGNHFAFIQLGIGRNLCGAAHCTGGDVLHVSELEGSTVGAEIEILITDSVNLNRSFGILDHFACYDILGILVDSDAGVAADGNGSAIGSQA